MSHLAAGMFILLGGSGLLGYAWSPLSLVPFVAAAGLYGWKMPKPTQTE